MRIVDAFINSIAVWFVLKAVEVIPLAAYDVFVSIKNLFIGYKKQKITIEFATLKDQYDTNRGKLEYIFAGDGFLQISMIRKSKKCFSIATLLPLFVFLLEILSIFLGNETRICESSNDPNVVKAPSLQLFTDGPRETSVSQLKTEIDRSRRTFRPCYLKQSSFSGVEYLASVCSDINLVWAPMGVERNSDADNRHISIVMTKEQMNSALLLQVYSRPSNLSMTNLTLLGSLSIFSEVLVNGKQVLQSDVVKDMFISKQCIEDIRNDVGALEKVLNLTTNEFMETSREFSFTWADLDEISLGGLAIIIAIISQSRSIDLRTAAEMSQLNQGAYLSEVDISCRQDYMLPKAASIAIVVIGAISRLLLMAVPKSLSSAEYALRISEGDEQDSSSSIFSMGS